MYRVNKMIAKKFHVSTPSPMVEKKYFVKTFQARKNNWTKKIDPWNRAACQIMDQKGRSMKTCEKLEMIDKKFDH